MTDIDTDTDTGYVVGPDADADIASHWRTGRWLKFVVHEQRIAAPVAPMAPDPLETSDMSGSVRDKARVLAARVKARVRRSDAAAVAADVLHDKPVAVFRSAALARLVVAEVNATHSPYPWGRDTDAASVDTSASI